MKRFLSALALTALLATPALANGNGGHGRSLDISAGLGVGVFGTTGSAVSVATRNTVVESYADGSAGVTVNRTQATGFQSNQSGASVNGRNGFGAGQSTGSAFGGMIGGGFSARGR